MPNHYHDAMQLKITENNLKLRYPFSISRHTYFSQQNIVVELTTKGLSGFGEATTNPYYKIDIENLTGTFRLMATRLKTYRFETPDKLWDDFADFLTGNSFALAALNSASWDLYGKMTNKPVADLLPTADKVKPQTSYTLGIDPEEKMLKKMLEFPWPIYKIKVGTPGDMELMRFLTSRSTSVFRVDANCGWETKQTIENASGLKAMGVEFIEQPLPRNHPGQKECYEKCTLPLIADESCCTEADVNKCAGLFHGINIKLLKCGGITPALRMIAEARSLGLKLMIGCMTESTIGISSAAQLLPLMDYADLDGPLLLAEDLATGLKYDSGFIITSDFPGLGIAYHGKKGLAL